MRTLPKHLIFENFNRMDEKLGFMFPMNVQGIHFKKISMGIL
jgi:hypothetical protein